MLVLWMPIAILAAGLARTVSHPAQQPSIYLLIASAVALVGLLTWVNPLVNGVIFVVSATVIATAPRSRRKKREAQVNEDDLRWREFVLDRDE